MSAAPAELGPSPARQRARRAASWRTPGPDAAVSKRLAGGIGVSALLHVAALAALLLHRAPPRPAEPPVYRVDLVAAPPGPRSIGTVTPEPPAAAPAPAPTPPKATPAPTPPPRAEAPPPKAKPLPTPVKAKPAPAKATPVPPTKANTAKAAPKTTTPPKATTPEKSTAKGTPGPRAGGGPEGGKGADVANVHVKGLDFPFPGYLANIVRQVALVFSPPRGGAYTADVSFLIHRDGSVTDVRFVRRSGSYSFDLEAQGAIEAVSSKRAFGPLPDEFRGDVLPVTFSFDPRVIR
ncbi:TonB domain-containing protein [Gemmatirosa kalamazoonensis]|uniref:TonB domain-containing protein n=1 Tax=Gemmatirosa kalamazoonensis TaxID=861299 RepID=W0RJ09_9BACT|nr:TonB C-terminal domain-containing protein [Gemmatirosa kalamazoonensis]AHG91089.1 TonB domain-containing protein [Gemmatirosa kalamazoonensis]